MKVWFGSFASFWLCNSHFRSTFGQPTYGRTLGFVGKDQTLPCRAALAAVRSLLRS